MLNNNSSPSTSAHEHSMGLDGILASLRKWWFLLGDVMVIIFTKLYPYLGAKEVGWNVGVSRFHFPFVANFNQTKQVELGVDTVAYSNFITLFHI